MQRRTVIAGTVFVLAGCVSPDYWANGEGDSTHGESGTIAIFIDGEPFDLSEDRFQAEYADAFALEFHLHEFDDRWYMEGDEPVSVGEGLNLLPHFACVPVGEEIRLEIDGTVYDGSDEDTTIVVTVNDGAIDPFDYVLTDGDDIIVEITQA